MSVIKAFEEFFEDVKFGVDFREGTCLPCNLPRRPEPAFTGHAMEHPLFLFGLISSRWCGDSFPTREEAQAFAKDIRESEVRPRGDYERDGFVVRVGPWMFAHDIRPRKYP